MNKMLGHEVSIYLASKSIVSVTYNHTKKSHTSLFRVLFLPNLVHMLSKQAKFTPKWTKFTTVE